METIATKTLGEAVLHAPVDAPEPVRLLEPHPDDDAEVREQIQGALEALRELRESVEQAIAHELRKRILEATEQATEAYADLLAAQKHHAGLVDEYAGAEALLAQARAVAWSSGRLVGPDGKPGRNDAERENIERMALADGYEAADQGKARLALSKAEQAIAETRVEHVKTLTRLLEAAASMTGRA